ncbi:hypothetical protein V8E53_009332 [Lactarius tabidus]
MSVEPNRGLQFLKKGPTFQRKPEGVLRNLDDALGPQDPSTERPHKRPHVVHTLYSALAKYGIKTRTHQRLQAIAAAKTRKAMPSKFRAATPMGSSQTASYEYRLSSTQNLLERLATYKLTRLRTNSLQLTQWQLTAGTYHIPFSSPAAMAKELKTRARSLESVQEAVEIRHLLSSIQIQATLSVIASVREEPTSNEKTGPEKPAERIHTCKRTTRNGPSSNTILTSLFHYSAESFHFDPIPASGASAAHRAT